MENRKNTGHVVQRTFKSGAEHEAWMEREIRKLDLKADLETDPRKKAELREAAARKSQALRKCRSLFSARKQRITFCCNAVDCSK